MPITFNYKQLNENLKKSLEDLGQYLIMEMRKELTAQGHKATGNLINSIQYQVLEKNGNLELEVSYLNYGAAMETGIVASRIPFGRGGGKSSKYIQGLMNWIRIKRLTSGLDKEVKSFAFAIANTHKKEGMPSRGSFAFSSNGRRVGFQRYILEQNEQQIQDSLRKEANTSLEIWVTDLINATLNIL